MSHTFIYCENLSIIKKKFSRPLTKYTQIPRTRFTCFQCDYAIQLAVLKQIKNLRYFRWVLPNKGWFPPLGEMVDMIWICNLWSQSGQFCIQTLKRASYPLHREVIKEVKTNTATLIYTYISARMRTHTNKHTYTKKFSIFMRSVAKHYLSLGTGFWILCLVSR